MSSATLPPGGMQLVSGSANFIRRILPMSAVSASRHPQGRGRRRAPCSRDLVAGEEEAEASGRRRSTQRVPPEGFSGDEMMATVMDTDFLTNHQELLHPKENLYFERENGGIMLRVVSLNDTISPPPVGIPK